MVYQEQLVDLLDRKYTLVNDLIGREFFLELENFFIFITTDERLQIFLNQLDDRFLKKSRQLALKKIELISNLQEIRDFLVHHLPDEENDENLSPPDKNDVDPRYPYFKSLALFDSLSHNLSQNLIEDYFSDRDANLTDQLINILSSKVKRELLDDEVVDQLLTQIHNAQKINEFLKRQLSNYLRASTEGALQALYYIASNINPKPNLPASWAEISEEIFKDFAHPATREIKKIQEVTYRGVVDEDLILQCKLYVRRSYEGLRAEISSSLIHSQVIKRYKTRSTWYDRKRLEYLINQNEGKEEDILTRDLALYLFDNGISTLYRIRRGVHEYDLISDEIKSNLFIEVKVYKSSKDLTKGFAQLHSYLNSLEAQSSIEEVYYIIFRLGGPLYDLPPSIPTNRRIFYPMIIDLGSSSESGSRQPSPVYLKLDDFFSALEKEVEEEK